MASSAPQIQSSGPIRVKAPANPAYTALLLVLVIMLGWFLVWPQLSKVTTKQQELAQLQSDQQVFGQQQTNLDRLVEQLRASKQDVALLDEAVPLDNRLSKVYVLVEAFARSAGLDLVNITADTGDSLTLPGAAGDDGQFKKERSLFTSTMSLTLHGTYDQFVTFLGFVEQSSRLIDVDSLDMAPGESGTLVFRLKLKSYFYTTTTAPVLGQTPVQ